MTTQRRKAIAAGVLSMSVGVIFGLAAESVGWGTAFLTLAWCAGLAGWVFAGVWSVLILCGWDDVS